VCCVQDNQFDALLDVQCDLDIAVVRPFSTELDVVEREVVVGGFVAVEYERAMSYRRLDIIALSDSRGGEDVSVGVCGRHVVE